MNIHDNQVRRYFFHTEPNSNEKHLHTAIETNAGTWAVEHHGTMLSTFKAAHPEWIFSRLYTSLELAKELGYC